MYKKAIVVSTTAPLRGKPDEKASLVDEALMGMVVDILSKEDEHYYIKTGYNYEGYIHCAHLLCDDVRADQWKDRAKNRIATIYCDVLKEPKYQSYSIANLVAGSIVASGGDKADGWVQIELPNQELGWIREEFIVDIIDAPREDLESLRKDLVKTAKSYLGTQYRWGGRSSIGIDCSGLCSMSYLINGITIYRDAIFKEEYLNDIGIDEMKPGDLIFYKGHIAMYIGENKIIHSTGSKAGVVIESLKEGESDYRSWLVDDIIRIGRHKIFY